MPRANCPGRPRFEDHQAVTVKVARADLDALRQLADEAVPLAVSVRRAIREYVTSQTEKVTAVR